MSDMALIVMVTAEDMQHVVAGWPDRVSLAVVLKRDGDCGFTVFHESETAEAPHRILSQHLLTKDRAAFVPKVPGYATKPFRYSDDRRLMALLATEDSLPELAHDYLLNFSYALEEGLDVSRLTGTHRFRPVAANQNTKAHKPEPQATGSSLLPEFLRHSAMNAVRPRFSSVRKAGPVSLAG
jgi:hypothetical protein